MTKEFLKEIKNWRKNNNLRFGQYLYYILQKGYNEPKFSSDYRIEDFLFYIEDNELVKLLEKGI